MLLFLIYFWISVDLVLFVFWVMFVSFLIYCGVNVKVVCCIFFDFVGFFIGMMWFVWMFFKLFFVVDGCFLFILFWV